jgi:hypothetical protein
MASSMPTSAATALADALLSPVSRTGRRPRSFQALDGFDRCRLDGIRHYQDGFRVSVPAGGDRGLPLHLGGFASGLELVREVDRPVGEQGGPSHDHRVALDDALDAEAFAVGEAFDGGQLVLGGCGRGDSVRDGVLGGALQRPDQAQRLLAVDALGECDVGKAHLAGGDGPGLIEHDRVHAAGGLEDLGALNQQPELGAAAGADHQCRRRGESERARAGDDQHRHRRRERERGGLPGHHPAGQGHEREADDDGDEYRRDAVGEALDRSLATPGVGDELGDLRERGVSADLGGAHDQPAAGVDGRAGDLGAGGDLDGNRLAGQHAHVDG